MVAKTKKVKADQVVKKSKEGNVVAMFETLPHRRDVYRKEIVWDAEGDETIHISPPARILRDLRSGKATLVLEIEVKRNA